MALPLEKEGPRASTRVHLLLSACVPVCVYESSGALSVSTSSSSKGGGCYGTSSSNTTHPPPPRPQAHPLVT